ncbi:hypothetical protein DSM112329_04725 [Paraconexibacter sp. AEG42_29]|uniref:Uncharacterized protein n=1 Tax=Paraconexibacter sp. AEG42_29 TaxID=2997339 RepID=A0AAU7B2S2_9ACTN
MSLDGTVFRLWRSVYADPNSVGLMVDREKWDPQIMYAFDTPGNAPAHWYGPLPRVPIPRRETTRATPIQVPTLPRATILSLKIVGTLQVLPAEITERTGVTFAPRTDGLGPLEIALIELDGTPYVLQRHTHSAQDAGTSVWGAKWNDELMYAFDSSTLWQREGT